MPNFIGTAGNFQKEKAINRRLNAVMALFISLVLMVFVLGWVSGWVFREHSLWSLAFAVVALALAIPCLKRFERQFDMQIRLARAEEDGAEGEREFIKFLKDLPDSYTVISDLDFADSYGNIDHLVVGPTGVFAIDVKNWRGTVDSDGQGELLYNGRPTDKPQIRYFTRRAMDLKDRIKALTKLDPYIQCVFAFLRTRVDANWGTTGTVHCIRAEQISDYITKGRGGNPITPPDMARLVKALKALKDLASTATPKADSRSQSKRNTPATEMEVAK